MYTERLLWKYYKHICWELTNKQDLTLLENNDKRGNNSFQRNSECYHLDHIVPIRKGFVLGIPPFLIASMDNLKFIPSDDNINKGIKLTDESHAVLGKWGIDSNYIKFRTKEWNAWKRNTHDGIAKPVKGNFNFNTHSHYARVAQLEEENDRLRQENDKLKQLLNLIKESYYEMRRDRNKNRWGIK